MIPRKATEKQMKDFVDGYLQWSTPESKAEEARAEKVEKLGEEWSTIERNFRDRGAKEVMAIENQLKNSKKGKDKALILSRENLERSDFLWVFGDHKVIDQC